MKPAVEARLVLEDGTEFEGESYGAVGTAVGELVFITSMSGYQEIVTRAPLSRRIRTMELLTP